MRARKIALWARELRGIYDKKLNNKFLFFHKLYGRKMIFAREMAEKCQSLPKINLCNHFNNHNNLLEMIQKKRGWLIDM